ncbi:vWA domain-containing protein [Sorangium sp. So ce134]
MAGPSTKWMRALSRSGSAEVWAPRALLLVTLLSAAAVIAGACSGDDSGLTGPQDGTGGPDGGTAEAGDPCADGEEVECHITVGEHEGVLTCMDGIRRCQDGRYGSCEGTMTMRRSPFGPSPRGSGESGYPRPLANSEASDGGLCATNPCDPSCQSFEETPDGGPIDLSGTGITYTWSVGDINELPESVARQGTHQPCTTSEDCQFDQYCEHPAQSACSHNPCETGGGLLTTCSGCIAKVCEARPSCCIQPTIPADCGHDACTTGTAKHMTTTCGDACIANICTTNPLCCEINCGSSAQCETLIGPGSTCISLGRCTPPTMGPTAGVCPPPTTLSIDGVCVPNWNASCRNLVATRCPGKSCPLPTSSWDATCVALAEQECGSTCSTDPGVQQGLCKAYLPNQTNPECGGVDLTVGVPCGGTIPVCNRGNTPAPAGIAIHRYPAGAGQLPSSAPSRILNSCSPTGGTLACTTTQPIAPGECISVAGCTGVADGMELIVNPPGPGQIAECQCANNGSIYQSAMCESPGCIATASVATIRPATLFVTLDRSASMTSGGASGSRWIPARNALMAFFADPASAGLGVALRFWPHNNPGPCDDSGGSCPGYAVSDCWRPIVPFDGTAARRLTADPSPIDQQEFALIHALDPGPGTGGDTPMYPALNGATTWAINYKNAHPEEEVAVVLVTDGIPSNCDTVPNHIGDLARNAFENHGVRVHAVGFGGSSSEIINLIATRGGGRAFNLAAGTGLETTLRDALVSIRGQALACDVTVPLAGTSDPASVSVVHVNSAGTETVLTPQAGLGSCGQGWYFADATNTSVKLCPQTCADLRESPGKVRATVPCVTTSLTPITTSWERYHGVCPPGTKTQWGYLRYRTATPGDSSVEFFVRAADEPDDLDDATVRLAATAHAVPTDTRICDESSTPPCAIDLFDVLEELPDARTEYLEVQMRLNPTSTGGGGVQVQDWEITYSCPDSE